MVRTGRRAVALRDLLTKAGMTFATSPERIRFDELPAVARDESMRLYAALGGRSATPRLAPGGWDLSAVDGLKIELDEQFHFTRYRGSTLETALLASLPWSSAYREFCTVHESAASRGGGMRWTSPSTERMFGPSDPAGQYGDLGSARGKQRALYDAIKDLATSTGAAMLARVSIYDTVGGATLDDILYQRVDADPRDVRELVERRTHTGGA